MRSISPRPLPGPPPRLWWLGNMLGFHMDHLGTMSDLHARYGDLVALARDEPRFVFAFSPRYHRDVLMDNERFHNKLFVMRIPPGSALARLSGSLLGTDGADHRRLRRLIAPALHRGRVEQYQVDIARITAEFCEHFAVGCPTDLSEQMRALTMRVAMKTLFGLDSSAEAREFSGSYQESFELLTSVRAFMFPVDVPGARYRRLIELAEVHERRILRMIEGRRRAGSAGVDTLSALIQARDDDAGRLNDAELVGQINSMLFASHDTTAHTLSWTLLLLAQHPRVLADVVDELDEVTCGAPLTLEGLPRLTLLDAVLRESQRLLPVVSFVGRVAQKDVALGEYLLPKGATVILSPYIVHRRADLYDRPHQFVPARWTTARPAPNEYLPFGMGAHSCPGNHLANLEMKTILAQLLRDFRVVLTDDVAVDYITRPLLRMKAGLPGEQRRAS